MATPKASLPKVNKCNQRTKLRARDLTTVNWLAGRANIWKGVSVVANASVSVAGLNKAKVQQDMDCGLLVVAP